MDKLTTEEAGYLCVALGRVMHGHNAPLSTLIGSNRNCYNDPIVIDALVRYGGFESAVAGKYLNYEPSDLIGAGTDQSDVAFIDPEPVPVMPEAASDMTQAGRRALMYAETCLVGAGGLMERARLCDDDVLALEGLRAAGIVGFGVIPSDVSLKIMRDTGRRPHYWITFTDLAWQMAHTLRREMAGTVPYGRALVNEALPRARGVDGARETFDVWFVILSFAVESRTGLAITDKESVRNYYDQGLRVSQAIDEVLAKHKAGA